MSFFFEGLLMLKTKYFEMKQLIASLEEISEDTTGEFDSLDDQELQDAQIALEGYQDLLMVNQKFTKQGIKIDESVATGLLSLASPKINKDPLLATYSQESVTEKAKDFGKWVLEKIKALMAWIKEKFEKLKAYFKKNKPIEKHDIEKYIEKLEESEKTSIRFAGYHITKIFAFDKNVMKFGDDTPIDANKLRLYNPNLKLHFDHWLKEMSVNLSKLVENKVIPEDRYSATIKIINDQSKILVNALLKDSYEYNDSFIHKFLPFAYSKERIKEIEIDVESDEKIALNIVPNYSQIDFNNLINPDDLTLFIDKNSLIDVFKSIDPNELQKEWGYVNGINEEFFKLHNELKKQIERFEADNYDPNFIRIQTDMLKSYYERIRHMVMILNTINFGMWDIARSNP